MEQAGNTGGVDVSDHQSTTEDSLDRRDGESGKAKPLLFQRRHGITPWVRRCLRWHNSGVSLAQAAADFTLLFRTLFLFFSIFCLEPALTLK